MSTYILYAVLASSFLRSETSSISGIQNIFGDLKNMQNRSLLNRRQLNIIKPYGCLHMIPQTQMGANDIACIKEIIGYIKNEISKKDWIHLPSMKEMTEDFTKCRLEKYDLIVDGKLSVERIRTMQSSMKYIKSNPEDVKQVQVIVDECLQDKENQMNSLSPVEAALTFESCYVKGVMDFCTATQGEESFGFVLPFIYAFDSLVLPNDRCDSVIHSNEMEEKYIECIAVESNMSWPEEHMDEKMEGNKKHKIFSVLSNINKLPEFKCLNDTIQHYKLDKDTSHYDSLAEFVSKLDGWNNDQVRTEVTDHIVKCGIVDDYSDWQNYLKSLQCFLPKFTETCGLNNDLSRNILFPMTDSTFVDDIINRLSKKFDLSLAMNMIPF